MDEWIFFGALGPFYSTAVGPCHSPSGPKVQLFWLLGLLWAVPKDWWLAHPAGARHTAPTSGFKNRIVGL